MLNRRHALLAFPALALAACAQSPVTDNEFMLVNEDVVRGAGDGVRTAAFGAQRAFGDPSQWRGNPLAACFGMAQLEFLNRSFTTNPRFSSTANFETKHNVREGQLALRRAAGIPPEVPALELERDLRLAVRELSQGNRPAADARLAAYGPDLIGRLTSLPSIRLVSIAAGAAAEEFRPSGGGGAFRL